MYSSSAPNDFLMDILSLQPDDHNNSLSKDSSSLFRNAQVPIETKTPHGALKKCGARGYKRPMGTPNASQLHYVEVMCESVLQGIYCVLVLVILWLLMRPKPMPISHRVMFIASIVMWALTCVHLGLVIRQATDAHTPVATSRAQACIATIQIIIGDMIIIWRVWAVWGQSYLAAALPFLLMICSASIRFAEVSELVTFAHRPGLADVATALLAANILLSTILISGRIWYMQWKTKKLLGYVHTQNEYHRVFLIVIESGSIYALAQIVELILDDIQSDGVHTVLDVQIPLIGILPTLIVLVVHFGLVPEHSTTNNQRSVMPVDSKFQAAPRVEETNSTVDASHGVSSVSLRMPSIHNHSQDHSHSDALERTSAV